jgi:hypothetical protein
MVGVDLALDEARAIQAPRRWSGGGMSILKPEWIGAIGSILLAILAVFQDKVRAWLTRPRLRLEARTAQPFCHKTSWTHPYPPGDPRYGPNLKIEYLPCYYFRLKISNVGNSAASHVEVFASALKHRRADQEFEPVLRFTPMNLVWAHNHAVYLPFLPPKMSKFCDLGHIIAPLERKKVGHDLDSLRPDQCILALDLESGPTMKGHLVEPGTYRLTLLVAAENARPREYEVELFVGDWHDSEEDMFRQGVGIHVI